MMELPETTTLARQMTEQLAGKKLVQTEAGYTPHGFAFYNGDPAAYPGLLNGRRFEEAREQGPFILVRLEDTDLLLGDGVNLRFLQKGTVLPAKRQLLLTWDDGSSLLGSVAMYGGMRAAPRNSIQNEYLEAARSRPSPLGPAFTPAFFAELWAGAKPALSAKAFLATEQRIPGLGNGVLQDILFNAHIHPKRRLKNMGEAERDALYASVRATMADMTAKGGRDTEKDLYGNPGGYATRLSAKTWRRPCPMCDGPISKQAYLGGSVYFCPACQPLA